MEWVLVWAPALNRNPNLSEKRLLQVSLNSSPFERRESKTMFAASWAFMLSGWRINEKDLPLKILNFGGFQQIKRRNPFGIWITPYYAEDSISDSAHLILWETHADEYQMTKKQNWYFPGPDSGRQAAMVWLPRWNQLKKIKRTGLGARNIFLS